MNSHRSASRITDVVPANFLCDSQTMERIAQSQLNEQRALEEVEENLSVLESRQRRLEDKLAIVEQLIDDAVAEQTRLRSCIATHRSLLSSSPVRALPGEVLSEIFLYYIALPRNAQDNVFKEIVASHRIHTPILLVCRRWRTTALADARLWTTIPLIGSGEGRSSSFSHPLISGSPEQRAAHWKALECRIETTSALPLHLLFHFHEDGRIGDPMYAVSSLQTFIRLFSRAHTISLNIAYYVELNPALKAIIDAADISHASGVHTARVKVLVDNVFGRKILSAIPNVEVLETRAQHIGHWFTDAPTAGHRLRSLHLISPIPLVQALDLLDRAPLLETLKVFRATISSTETLRVVTHMRLSTFHLASANTEQTDAVFSHLTLPALRSLSHAGSEFRPHAWLRPIYMAFLQRSSCILESLAFSRCHIDKKCLLEVLAAQKALVTLQLNFRGAEGRIEMAIPSAIIEFLSSKPEDGSDHPLPALTSLTVLVLPRQLWAMRRLVRSRSAEQAKECRIAALREVHIQVHAAKGWDYRDNSDDDSDDDSDDNSEDVKIQNEKHAALFKDFASIGIDIRISYERV